MVMAYRGLLAVRRSRAVQTIITCIAARMSYGRSVLAAYVWKRDLMTGIACIDLVCIPYPCRNMYVSPSASQCCMHSKGPPFHMPPSREPGAGRQGSHAGEPRGAQGRQGNQGEKGETRGDRGEKGKTGETGGDRGSWGRQGIQGAPGKHRGAQ